MNTANAQLEAANADIKGLTEQNDQLRSRLDAAEAREEEAWKMQSKAEPGPRTPRTSFPAPGRWPKRQSSGRISCRKKMRP